MAANKGLVLGIYCKGDEDKAFMLTPATQKYDSGISGAFAKLLPLACNSFKKGKNRVFYGLDPIYTSVAVVSLGASTAAFSELEEIDEKRENVRIAVASGVRQLRDGGATTIDVDPCGDAEAAAEGAALSLHSYDELKQESSRKSACILSLIAGQPSNVIQEWQRGLIKAEGQNLARRLMESPANVMTPTRFAEIANEALSPKGVKVIPRNKEWATEKKMGSYLSVTKGSDEPPVFLEISYQGGSTDEKPLVLVGKGITFDSGGISIKPSASMDKMRADMGGAACVVGSIFTAASLKLPINVIGLTPLCENMPSGRASKPGDVVKAMNGKSIQIDNTDAEGRLVLADALCYAQSFQPKAIIDLATLTGAMIVALGSAAAGVFTNSSVLWKLLHESGAVTGDRVWRMPLFEHYSRQVTECLLADVNNIGTADRAGGSCTAAAFLKEFVTASHWAHIDIAGVMENKDEVPYLCKGMAGRPTRTLVEFINKFAMQKPL